MKCELMKSILFSSVCLQMCKGKLCERKSIKNGLRFKGFLVHVCPWNFKNVSKGYFKKGKLVCYIRVVLLSIAKEYIGLNFQCVL